jgi:hypothetical protein
MLDHSIQIVARSMVIQDGLAIDFSTTRSIVPNEYIDSILVEQLDQSPSIVPL